MPCLLCSMILDCPVINDKTTDNFDTRVAFVYNH